MGIEVSSTAATEIRRILSSKDKKGWGLRVGVKGGGCSGLSYTMDFSERPQEHDKITHVEDFNIYVDPKSYLFVNGMTLDFSTELMGGGFNFINPNATATCSCGQSFSA